MNGLQVLDRAALPAVATLCRRGIPEPPTFDELDDALFAADQPAVLRGDPQIGVVATVTGDAGAYVRLLVVDPDARGHGHGHTLMHAAESDARAAGQRSVTIGADAPFFLWPGVPSGATALLCLLERHRYTRVEANFDMTVDLATIPDDPGGHSLATPDDHDELESWMATHWPNWKAEVLRALHKGNLVIARDDVGISAFCGFEVNRAGFLGPVAARPDLIGRHAGRPVLLGALHELRGRGRDHIEVTWVGPVVPYARVGGHVSSVYFVYRRELR
ncbi:MAG: GNAT family N-acetyltransferase [Acidimicrobiia bacterium]